MKDHRFWGLFGLTILGLCIAGIAQAQTRVTPCNPATPNNAACVTWDAPTLDVNGLPIVLALTYRVQMQTGTGTFSTVVPTTSLRQHYATNLAPGTYTFRIFATVGTAESVASNSASRDVPQAPPMPPTGVLVVKVTISDDHPPVYRIAGDGHSLTGTVYGAVPTGRSCGEFVVRWRNINWHRITIRNPDEEIFPAEARDDPELLANLAAPCSSS